MHNNIKLGKICIQHQNHRSNEKAKRYKNIRNILVLSLYLFLFVTAVNFFDIKLIKNAYASTINYIDEGVNDIKEQYENKEKINFIKEKTNDRKLAELIVKYSKKNNIDEKLLLALIKVESKMDPNALNYNKNGTIDRGLCQLNSFTFKHIDAESLFRPETNIKHGAEFLSWCLKHSDNSIYKALAIYNAGIGNYNSQNIGQSTFIYINRIIFEKKKLDAEFREYLIKKL